VGREGIEPPVSIDGSFTDCCAPWRDRPTVGADCGAGSDDDLFRCGCQGAGGRTGCPARWQARKESNPRPSVLETAAPPWLEPQRTAKCDWPRMTECADWERGRWRNPKIRLPAHAGIADFGISRARRPTHDERSAGQARGHAEDGVGIAPLRLLGEEFACHRRTIVKRRLSKVKRFFSGIRSSSNDRQPRRRL
jgi:hypothetical protein